MLTLRLGAALFLVYALALLGNAAFYISWSEDAGELPRVLVRVVGVLFVAVGIWRARRWAWWAGVIVGGLFLGLGILGLALLPGSDALEGRPYPIADYAFLIVILGALLGAVLVLLLPGSRSAIRAAA